MSLTFPLRCREVSCRVRFCHGVFLIGSKKKIFNNKTIGGNWKLSIIDGKFVGETVVKQEFSGSRER